MTTKFEQVGRKTSSAATIMAALTILSTLMYGCSAPTKDGATAYETIASDPRRNTDLARQYNEKGIRLLDQNRLDEAEKMFKSALAADVMFGNAHNNLGSLYFRQDKLYLAAWEFEYAAKVMPGQSEPNNNLGLVLESAGKVDQAVEAYEKALGSSPQDPQVLGNLVRARIRRGDSGPEIVRLLELVISRDPRPQWVEWARENRALLTRRPSSNPL